jgi:hypothetical protein
LIKTFVPVDIVYFSQNKESAYWEKYTMSTGTKVFINCLQHKHSLCCGRSTQCPQEQKFLSIVYNISTLFVLGEVHNVHRNKSFYQLETAYVVFMRYKWLGGRVPDSLSPRYILKLFDKNIKYSYSYN